MENNPKDTIDMVKKVEFVELGEVAEGKIEAGSDQQERLEEFTERVGHGEFHVAVEGRLPCGCIDGRGGCSLKPNSAGGSESLMVADDLTIKRFAAEDGSTIGAYRNVLSLLRSAGYQIGGHDDQHAEGDASGCGANDKLNLIYNIMARKSNEIRAIAQLLGVNSSDETHQSITHNASSRQSFSKGCELLDELNSKGGEESVDHLLGDHKEVIAVINKRFGTTLDRDVLQKAFGPDYQAFNVDVWSFEEAARVISLDEQEVQDKVIAMVYYNIAAALVLCGENMRVVVVE